MMSNLITMKKLLWISLATMLVLASCTTQKRKGELSGLGKAWHNTTAHYNGYFNAEELVQQAFVALGESHQDNYSKLLPMYAYMVADNPLAIAGNMDTAIKKVTIVLNLHPYSHWADDCYLLAGKAMFLKRDYEGAEKTFRFLLSEYPEEDPKSSASAKNKKGKSAKNQPPARSGSSGGSQAGRSSSAMTAKQKARERKRYNRQVKKKRRASSSSRSTPARKPSAPADTPAAVPDKPETATAAAPDPQAASNKDNPYFLKHRPAYQEGSLWLAKTLVERDNHDGARRLLNNLYQNPTTFADIRDEIAAVQAYLAIKERKYDLAITYLTDAVALSDNRLLRARFSYILAQLHQLNGNSQAAYAAFELVVKSHPSYEMTFSARLNMAQNSYLSGRGTAQDAMRNLEKMAADEKNKPFLDQLYFAMANIAFQQDDRDEGIALLRKSLAASSGNSPQKAEAYYKLANLFFETEDYLAAKNYMDSTLLIMPETDERFKSVERLRDNLSDIAEALETISLQDSLLRISELSPKEQADLAAKLLEQEKEAAKAKAAAASAPGDKSTLGGRPEMAMAGPGAGRPALAKPSTFFAYDERAVSRGIKEFNRTWNNRPLEDDWRRSGRALSDDAQNQAGTGDKPSLLSEDEVNQMLAGVPKTDADREKARLEIKRAMFELGRLYRDRLENNEKSVAILEQLDSRFPANLHELESWYYLYLGSLDLQQPQRAEEWKAKIINKYPSSNFARILKDPNYATEFLNEERKLVRLYDDTYALFTQGKFTEALAMARANSQALLGQNPLKPKYALLIAMCMGNTSGKEAYVEELNKLIATYPESTEQTRAREILRLLGATAGPSLPGQSEPETTGVFTVNQQDLHYILIIFESADVDINTAKNKVSDYNRTFHDLARLRISNVYLGQNNNIPVLVLRRFENQADAMAYYNGISKNSSSFVDATAFPHKVYAISQSNYREVLKARQLDGYEVFFKDNYLNK